MIRKITNSKLQIPNIGFTLIRTRLRRNLVNVHAFTLIELLVVISVIGILAALLFARFGTVDKNGRDARRKSDMNQYRLALENYAVKTNGVYPSSTSFVDASDTGGLCAPTRLGVTYMSSCVQDPFQDATYFYRYISDGTGSWNANATQYMLWNQLENGGSTPFLYVCSSGKIGTLASTPDTSACW